MKRNTLLVITSLVSAVLLTLHISHDIAFNLDPAGLNHVTGQLIVLVIVIGAVLLPRHRVGQVIMLLGGVMAAGMLPLHMRHGYKPEFLQRDGVLLFTWTMYILGVLGYLSIILAVMELLAPRRALPSPPGAP